MTKIKINKEEEVQTVQNFEYEGAEIRRNFKNKRNKVRTTLAINNSVQGDTIEVMIERLREGEGEESIEDRDLVYNDNESATVNPITNIRTDVMEARLDEVIGKQDFNNRKLQRTKDAEEERKKKEAEQKETKETGTDSTTE